jgi:hypothetical protein
MRILMLASPAQLRFFFKMRLGLPVAANHDGL